ncbi:MAG: hypothetical protein ACXVBV_21375 [Isosphaeraceae bacterium]
MTGNRKDMSCGEFSASMADLIASGQDIFAHPHVRKCKLHRALLDDLQTIAKAARELLREVDPPDTLWDGIQARLGFDHESAPTITDVGPGYRVMFAVKVFEPYKAGASPPCLDASSLEEKPSRPTIIQPHQGSVRREGRR